MKKTYIYDTVCELIDKYGTRNPFQLMESLNIQLFHSSLSTPKGYSIISYGIGYAAVSDTLDSYERRIVGAHELGHLILHADKLKVAAFRDWNLYKSNDKTEHEANLFAAELLLSDEEVVELAEMEQSDYFSMASILCVSPELLAFKLFGMAQRGFHYNVPSNIDSGFLGNK